MTSTIAGVHAFDVLGDPVRRRILELLADGELPPGRSPASSRPSSGSPSRPCRSTSRSCVTAGSRRSGRRAPGGSTPSTRHRSASWMTGSTTSAGSGISASTRSRPSWPAASVNVGSRAAAATRHRRRRPDDRHRPVRSTPSSARSAAAGSRPARAARSACSADYDAPIEDVWDALTNPERIGRWFLPISGDFRIGGRYQFEGNAGGEIVACDRPNRLRVTWVYGEIGRPGRRLRGRGAAVGVEARTTRSSSSSTPPSCPRSVWDEYGPGAVGVGWDMGVLGLALHLRRRLGRRPDRLAGLGRGARVRDPQQRGVGRREPGRRRRPGHRRARRREHDRVLCAGAARRDVADRSAAPKNRAGRVRVNVGVSLAPPTASSTFAPPTA